MSQLEVLSNLKCCKSMSNVKWICEELMLEVKYGCAGLNGCCHGLIRPAALGNADLVTRGPLENSHQWSICRHGLYLKTIQPSEH